MFKKILNWILNSNPIFKYIDGYKLQIGGTLAALALILDSVASFLPVEVSVQVLIISTALKTIAGYCGVVGGLGRIVKGGKST